MGQYASSYLFPQQCYLANSPKTQRLQIISMNLIRESADQLKSSSDLGWACPRGWGWLALGWSMLAMAGTTRATWFWPTHFSSSSRLAQAHSLGHGRGEKQTSPTVQARYQPLFKSHLWASHGQKSKSRSWAQGPSRRICTVTWHKAWIQGGRKNWDLKCNQSTILITNFLASQKLLEQN